MAFRRHQYTQVLSMHLSLPLTVLLVPGLSSGIRLPDGLLKERRCQPFASQDDTGLTETRSQRLGAFMKQPIPDGNVLHQRPERPPSINKTLAVRRQMADVGWT